MASQRHDRVPNNRNAQLLELLMREHRDLLIRQARLHSEQPVDAEDALSEASIKFLSHFPGAGGEHALAWMLVVVKRCAWAISQRRRKRREIVEEISTEAAEQEYGRTVVDQRRGPEQLAEAGEEVARVLAAMAALKPDERRALLLIGAGYSYEEVGRICGWTKTKINRCVAEGRSRLRRLLREGGETP